MKNIKKLGNDITYKTNGRTGSWLLVEKDGQKWFYVTRPDLPTPKFDVEPDVVNRKGMFDLLVHFVGGNNTDVFKKD